MIPLKNDDDYSATHLLYAMVTDRGKEEVRYEIS